MKDYTIYVTEEIAKKAMEKGFECKIMNYSADLFYEEFPPHFHDSYNNYFLPTAEQICGWLREEKNILITISQMINGDYPYYGCAYEMNHSEYGKTNNGYDYKEVLLGIIDKALEII